MDKRILISTGIALVFVLAWQFVFQPMFFPAPPPAPAAAAVTTGAAEPVKPADPSALAVKIQDVAEAPPIVLASASHVMTLTNKGAGIRELVVKDPKGKPDVVVLKSYPRLAPHLAFRQDGGPEAIQSLGWEIVDQNDRSASFRYRLSTGVEILKTFDVGGAEGGPSMKVRLSNAAAPAQVTLELLALNGLEHDGDYRYEQYSVGAVHVDKSVMLFPLHQVLAAEGPLAASYSKPTPAEQKEAWDEARKSLSPDKGQKSWFGLKNRFYTVAVYPDEAARNRIESIWFRAVPKEAATAFDGLKNMTVLAKIDAISVGSAPESWSFNLFAGPLKAATLKPLPGGDALLNYGGGCAAGCGPLGTLFAPMVLLVNTVAPLILGALTLLAGLFGNAGVAIIGTTLLIRLCLFPLSKRSQVSMFRMQQLGPKIAVLRERYKDDQQKFGLEQMKLFREHKVNPLSGCLPVLLQMPIFIAMYSVFEISVELRGEPFMLWMTDLSQPDRAIKWAPQNINLLFTSFTLDALNVLPIVMTVTWFLQAYFAPRSPDPQMAAQQKMMMFMPIVFGLMCYNLASGLSLYFFVNSLLSMGEQKLIKKLWLKPPPEGGPASLVKGDRA